jgi:protein ImuA
MKLRGSSLAGPNAPVFKGLWMIAQLRQRLLALQSPPGLKEGPGTLPLGIPAIDTLLGGGLMRGALHEITAASEAHLAAAAGFASGLAALRGSAHANRTLFWIAEDMALTESGVPHGAGLDAFGLAPERLVAVAVAHRRDLLWAMEEALRCRAVNAVIGEIRCGGVDSVAARRLSYAAAEGSTLALLLRASPSDGASTAATRWIVGAAPSVAAHAPGAARFAAQLIRNRRGPTGSWILEWSDSDERFILATHAQPVAAPALDRPYRQVA